MNKETLEVLLLKKLSYRKIAKQLNCSFGSIPYWVRKYGLEKPLLCDNNQKYCKICEKYKSKDDFYTTKGQMSPYCKTCTCIKSVTYQRVVKQQCIDYKGGRCEKCGYNKSNSALHFHHISSLTKEFSISKKKNNFESLKKELDKCILLCSNCHAEEHDRIGGNNKKT